MADDIIERQNHFPIKFIDHKRLLQTRENGWEVLTGNKLSNIWIQVHHIDQANSSQSSSKLGLLEGSWAPQNLQIMGIGS